MESDMSQPLRAATPHPPLLLRESHGAWMLPLFRILAGLRGLRGT
eukprot:gene35838-48191_t